MLGSCKWDILLRPSDKGDFDFQRKFGKVFSIIRIVGKVSHNTKLENIYICNKIARTFTLFTFHQRDHITSLFTHVKLGSLPNGFRCGSFVNLAECFMVGFIDRMYGMHAWYMECTSRNVSPQCQLCSVKQWMFRLFSSFVECYL